MNSIDSDPSIAGQMYYMIRNKSDSGPSMRECTVGAHSERDCLCTCNGVRPEFERQPVSLNFNRRPQKAIAHAYPARAYPIELVSILEKYTNELIVGNVTATKSKTICENYRSVYVRRADGVDLRGERGSRYKQCEACGVIWLRWAGGSGEVNLISHSIRDRDVLIYASRLDILVSKRVADEIKDRQFKGIMLIEVPVRDSPLDGFTLPGDPDWSAIDPDFIPNTEETWVSEW